MRSPAPLPCDIRETLSQSSPAPHRCRLPVCRIGAVALSALAVTFSGCASLWNDITHADFGDAGGLVAIGLTAGAVASTTAGAAVGGPTMIKTVNAETDMIQQAKAGKKLTPEEQAKLTVTPHSERHVLGHYPDSIPAYEPGILLRKEGISETARLAVSAFHVFESGIDLQKHTGWGGAVEYLFLSRESGENKSLFHARASSDFIYFDTTANVTRGGVAHHEVMRSWQSHVNFGGGASYAGFDLDAWAGLGFGATYTRGTLYNERRHRHSTTTWDALLQLSLRLTYHPTEWCEVFAGYRVMWDAPIEYFAKQNSHYFSRYPTVGVQAAEFGVAIKF